MRYSYLIIIFSFLIMSCSPSMSAVWQKEGYNTHSFDRLAVIVIDKNLEVRQNLENDIIEQLSQKYPSITYVRGLDLVPPNAAKTNWSESAIESKLEELNIDGVLTTCIIDSYEAQQRRSGGSISYPVYYRAGRRIYSNYRYIDTPDYYESINKFVLQSTLYDLTIGDGKEDNMTWMGESSISDPSSITSGAASYTDNLVKFIVKNDVLK